MFVDKYQRWLHFHGAESYFVQLFFFFTKVPFVVGILMPLYKYLIMLIVTMYYMHFIYFNYINGKQEL